MTDCPACKSMLVPVCYLTYKDTYIPFKDKAYCKICDIIYTVLVYKDKEKYITVCSNDNKYHLKYESF